MIQPGRLFFLFVILSGPLVGLGATQQQIHYWVPRNPPRAEYKIEADVNLDTASITGSGTVEFTNHSIKPLAVIAFKIRRPTILEISQQTEPLTLETKNGNIHFFRLPEILAPAAKVRLTMDFKLLRIELSDGIAFAASHWIPTLWWDAIPHVNNYRVSITGPPDYAISASGHRLVGENMFVGKEIREFGIFIGKNMKSETVDAGGVRITALFTEAGLEAGRYCLETAADAVSFYQKWLGFYPFDFLYVLPGGPGVWGGYPMATGMVRIHGMEKFQTAPALHWKWITAHEIGHQYWGENVLDGDNPQWLWIGLGVYADREYTLSRNIGAKKQIDMMQRFSDAVRKNYDTTVDVTVEQRRKRNFDFNNHVVHGKGFSMISALELAMGKETFQKAYRRALTEFAGNRLSWRDFQNICETESGENLNWFFQQWVRANRYVGYRVATRRSYQQGAKWISEVTIKRQGTLAMSVPVRAVFEDETSQTLFTDRVKGTDILVFESDARLWDVIVDPNQRLPNFTEDLPPPQGSIADLVGGLPWSGSGEEAIRLYRGAENEPNLENRTWFKLGLVLFDGGYYQEAYQTFHKSLESDPPDLYAFVATAWMGQLQDLLGNRETALEHYRQALKIEKGMVMRHDQYGLQIDKAWIERLLEKPFVW